MNQSAWAWRCRGSEVGGNRKPDLASLTEPAFSLIELLVVVALMLVLTTLYWGGKNGGTHRRSLANCRLNLDKLYISFQIYANDNGTRFPVVPGAVSAEQPLDLLIPKYCTDTSLFLCPGTATLPLPPGDPLRSHKIGYAYYMGRSGANPQEALLSDAQVDALPKSSGQNAFSANGKPPGNNHGNSGGNFLFGDGQVQETPAKLSFSVAVPSGVVLLNPKR